MDRQERIGRSIVTVDQMQAIEQSMFEAGMPVAALMEKAALKLVDRLMQLYLAPSQVGILVGTGHNGGDALVVARELSLQGYEIKLHCPVNPTKELTLTHLNYARRLGLPLCEDLEELHTSDWLIDGLFGFGLSRALSAQAQALIEQVNQWDKPVVALDLPSGLDGNTGKPWGAAIRAKTTLCLGLWKLGLLQEDALPWVGQVELIDIGISPPDPETLQRVTPNWITETLPLPKPPTTHKYEQGHLLLVVGSDRYPAAAVWPDSVPGRVGWGCCRSPSLAPSNPSWRPS
ncbi:MAG: NAD(P)H-hydrate epimerase, partial [Alkalinema sp. RU_4_3]|nr:NAD(P)H-hydrate epimerase [Alkalinema sp. RU_4_3]